MNDFPVIQTSRLLLRELVPSDANAILRILGSSSVMRLSGCEPLADVDAAASLIDASANWKAATSYGIRWGIELKDDTTLIGTCGLFSWNYAWRKCTVGYELDTPWQKKGLMFEALSKMLAWGFYAKLLHRVEAQVHPENFPSIKLLESLGFMQEGRAREAGHWDGQIHDMLQFGLLWHELRFSRQTDNVIQNLAEK